MTISTQMNNELNLKAAIDIGTNTFHLLIGETVNGKLEITYKHTIPVKLGEGGGISRGEIIPAAYHRGLEALKYFKKIIDQFAVKEVKATATAAVRDADNGTDFIEDIYQLTEIKIDIITGKQEAEYIYKGAKAAGILTDEKTLIIDIGGGSTELIIANQSQIFWKESYRIGAARLLADFHKSDPISPEDMYALNRHLDQILIDFFKACEQYKPYILIGTAGSFDSFRDMILISEAKDKLINYRFQKQQLTELLVRIIRSTHEQRSYMRGLIPLRVDMILMASLLVKFTLDRTQIGQIYSSSYSLREGLLFDK